MCGEVQPRMIHWRMRSMLDIENAARSCNMWSKLLLFLCPVNPESIHYHPSLWWSEWVPPLHQFPLSSAAWVTLSPIGRVGSSISKLPAAFLISCTADVLQVVTTFSIKKGVTLLKPPPFRLVLKYFSIAANGSHTLVKSQLSLHC